MLIATLALMLVAVLAGCGSSGTSPAGSDNEIVVNMKDMAFNPKTLEIKAGTTVKWVNQDQVDHSVAEGDGEVANPKFKSPDFSTGKDWSYTFTETGEYDISCITGAHYLLGMKMKVVVK